MTGDTGVAIVELAANAGVGIGGAGGVSGIAIVGGLDGCPRRLTVVSGPRLPLLASILGVVVAGAGVNMGKSAPGGLTGGSCREGAVE